MLRSNGPETLFDFEYPLFDESYRDYLEQSFVEYFLTREISMLPVPKWKIKFASKFRLAITELNQYYSSQLYKYNPFTTEMLFHVERKDRDNKTIVDYASLLEAVNKTRDNYSGSESSKRSEVGDTTSGGTSKSETEYNDTTRTVFDGSKTLDEDTTQRHEEKGTENITRHTDTRHADYPQANLAATGTENPGEWWSTRDVMDGTDNNDRQINIDLTKNLNSKETEDSTTNVNKNGMSTTTGNTTGTGTSKLDVGVDGKVSSGRNISADNTSLLKNTEGRAHNEKENLDYKTSGYRNISPADLIIKHRSAIINVDQMLFDRMETMFMGVW